MSDNIEEHIGHTMNIEKYSKDNIDRNYVLKCIDCGEIILRFK
jgi:hypothetical protein